MFKIMWSKGSFKLSWLLVCTLFLSAGCFSKKGELAFKDKSQSSPVSNGSGSSINIAAPESQELSYQNIRASILEPHCLRCHDKEAPILSSYQAVKENLSKIEQSVIKDLTMPPKAALPRAHRALLGNWIKAGAPLDGIAGNTDVPEAKWPELLREQKGCADLSDRTWKKIWRRLGHDETPSQLWKSLRDQFEKAQSNCLAKNIPEQYLACFQNAKRLTTHETLTHQKGHSMQFVISDRTYIENQPKEMLAFPDELKNGLPADWKTLCAQKGWICAKFVSPSLPNPPKQSFWRLIVMVAGERFDRWMLFTLPANGIGTQERLIDFMSVEHHRVVNGNLQKLQKALLHFTEYWREPDGTKPVIRKDIASCYKCHPNGMRDIVPAVGSLNLEELEVIRDLNKIIKDYGAFDWGHSIDIGAFGPAMGEKQGCTTCHNGVDRGALTAGHLGERSRHQLFFKMVQDLSMPPKMREHADYKDMFHYVDRAYELTPEEQRHLYRPERLESLVHSVSLFFGGDRGPVAEDKADVLNYLNDHRLLSDLEYSRAKGDLKKLSKEMESAYHQMMKDYEVRLTRWLQGDRPECAGLF